MTTPVNDSTIARHELGEPDQRQAEQHEPLKWGEHVSAQHATSLADHAPMTLRSGVAPGWG